MTLDRRRFLGTLPTISLGLAAGQARAQQGTAAPPAAPAPAPITDDDTLVLLAGDALPRNPALEPALDALDGAEQRFAAVRAAGERLLAGLERTAGFTVQRVADGSNLAGLEIAPQRLDGLEERLRAANVRIGKVQDGKVQLGFNESILRRDTAYLLNAFCQP